MPALPDEWHDFKLMRDMGWSWQDLSGRPGPVPHYVACFCRDFLELIDQAKADRNRR